LGAALDEILGKNAHLSVYEGNATGQPTLIVAYLLYYAGNLMLPQTMQVIEGYRKLGSQYQLIAESGEAFANCDSGVSALKSPRKDELWLAVGGRVLLPSNRKERFGIYSFDGDQFKALWGPETKDEAIEHFFDDHIEITYFGEDFGVGFHKNQQILKDTLRLT